VLLKRFLVLSAFCVLAVGVLASPASGWYGSSNHARGYSSWSSNHYGHHHGHWWGGNGYSNRGSYGRSSRYGNWCDSSGDGYAGDDCNYSRYGSRSYGSYGSRSYGSYGHMYSRGYGYGSGYGSGYGRSSSYGYSYPRGGVSAGFGDTAPSGPDSTLIILGSLALLAAFGCAGFAMRRTRFDS